MNEAGILEGVKILYGEPNNNVADYLYLFKEDPEVELTDEQVKQETAVAYNKVGNTAHIKGNLKKAKAVMNYIGYTDEEF